MNHKDEVITLGMPGLFRPKTISETIQHNIGCIEQKIDPVERPDIDDIIEEQLAGYVKGEFPTAEEIDVLAVFWFANKIEGKSHLLPLCKSYYLTKLAEKYLKENNVELAWSALSEARYYCGVLGEFITDNEERQKEKTVRDQRSKGGIVRANKNIMPARQEVIRLLKDKCPPEKWGSEKQAAQAIAQDSLDFIVKEKISLMHNIETHTKTIITWMKNEAEVKAAFLECCSRQ
jgi:hypothetical protein